ncbi:MAG TPA: hypothetical protein VLQ90_00315, partial [Pyrinomonadaceae bacterium]|nr:hypothetical protein [Pyrinomonadaceae bacterium]
LVAAALTGIAECTVSLTWGAGVVVSAIGDEVSMSLAGALTAGALTEGAGTTLNGVPSTGQKLNLSANCS